MADHTPDRNALLARYRAERDKRLRADRREVPQLTGELAHYLDDPYVTPVSREPVADEVDVIVVGAGMGGLQLGAELYRAGAERIRLIDSAGDVGGVWYWNRYPGAMCDVESLIYMPYLEELGYTPTMRYAPATEIAGHCQAIAKHFGLYDLALFQTTVTSASWDEEVDRWTLTTDRGDALRARYLVLSGGVLSKPRLPAIPGIESFRGKAFHTSRWDYAVTGGGPDREMDALADQRVGVVGTGATGIQCVPPLGRAAKEVLVFQRTPSTVAVRDNRPIDPEWAADQQPGWERARRENFTAVLAGDPVDDDMVQDSWTDLYRSTVAHPGYREMSPDQAAELKEAADFSRMEEIRARVDDIVEDPETAEGLKPYYAYFCKRPGFHDEYLAAFNRPNVRLVDTDGRGPDQVTERGVVVGGAEYELDCIVFATGFEIETPYTQRMGFDIAGRRGLLLSEKWRSALSTLHGVTTRGFPNMFVVPGLNAQSVVTANVVHSLSENAQHIAYIVSEVDRRGARHFEVTEEAEQAWVAEIVRRAPDRTAFLEACTPGRYNNEGRIDLRPAENANWAGSQLEFFRLLARWRDEGDLEGLALAR